MNAETIAELVKNFLSTSSFEIRPNEIEAYLNLMRLISAEKWGRDQSRGNLRVHPRAIDTSQERWAPVTSLPHTDMLDTEEKLDSAVGQIMVDLQVLAKEAGTCLDMKKYLTEEE